jgi:hypothetical protein
MNPVTNVLTGLMVYISIFNGLQNDWPRGQSFFWSPGVCGLTSETLISAETYRASAVPTLSLISGRCEDAGFKGQVTRMGGLKGTKVSH